MREILFRGFHECENGTHKAYYSGEWHKGEWVYGDLSQHKSGKVFIKPHYQSATHSKEVTPETVCQYIEFDDKNEKKIFDGDIVRACGGIYFQGIYEYDYIEEIKFYEVFKLQNADSIEIIGNKFENPEFLEVGE